MTRRMSCALTTDAVLMRTKTVTRRHVDTWQFLRPGDQLTLIEKGMGLPKGTKQVVLAQVQIVDVRVESLGCVLTELGATRREGLGHLTPEEFITFWLKSHGYHATLGRTANERIYPDCRRIQWEYL